FIRPGTDPPYVTKGSGERYRSGRRSALDQFVLHYDVCGTSRKCFDILHHLRGLSVHFLLDIDGTLYQTMDLGDTAWHATRSNDRSIGVEIAHIGARLPKDLHQLDEWYTPGREGMRLTLPERYGDGGVRTRNFEGYAARPRLIEGRINGSRLLQYDFTDEQYETLCRLLAVLTRELPGLPMRFPRGADGAVKSDVLDEAEWESFAGILGHYHVQKNKTDPGPAFDWERLQRAVRELR
ncbi:MAG: N-acetylmuramoyl-L-alanine amidase, partial [Candidatus Paceibacteria bacterium]